MNTSIGTFGTTTYPFFGGVKGGGNNSSVEAVNGAFTGITSTLKTIPVADGNEIYAQAAWLKLVEAQQMFVLACAGKLAN